MLQEIERDNLNSVCVECGANLPEFISINNGVYICKNCAMFHLTLPKEISKIIRNDNKELTFHEIKYIYFGGNKRLLEFIENEYPKLKLFSPATLFKTRVMQYYRKRLKNLVKGIEDNTLQKPMMQFAYQLIDDIKVNDNDLSYNNQKLIKNNNSVGSLFYLDDKQNKLITMVNNTENLNNKDTDNYDRYKKLEGNRSLDKINCKNNIIINNNYNIKLDKKVVNKIKALNEQKEEKEGKEKYNNLMNNQTTNNHNNKNLTINVDNSNYFSSNMDKRYNEKSESSSNKYYNSSIKPQSRIEDRFLKLKTNVLNKNNEYLIDGKFINYNPKTLKANDKIKENIFYPLAPKKKLSGVTHYSPTESKIKISYSKRYPSAKKNTIYSKPKNNCIPKKINELEKTKNIKYENSYLDKTLEKKDEEVKTEKINKKISYFNKKFKNQNLDNSENDENINNNNNYNCNINYDPNIKRKDIISYKIKRNSYNNDNTKNSNSLKNTNNSSSLDKKKLIKSTTVISKISYKKKRKNNNHKKLISFDNMEEIPIKTIVTKEKPKNLKEISIDKLDLEIVPKETEIQINKQVMLIEKKLENIITEVENLSDISKKKISFKGKNKNKKNEMIQKILTLITDGKNDNISNNHKKNEKNVTKFRLSSKNKSTLDLERNTKYKFPEEKKTYNKEKIRPSIENNKYSTLIINKEKNINNETNNTNDTKKNKKMKYYTSTRKLKDEEPKEKSFIYKSSKNKLISKSRENSPSNKSDINKKSIRNKYKKLRDTKYEN